MLMLMFFIDRLCLFRLFLNSLLISSPFSDYLFKLIRGVTDYLSYIYIYVIENQPWKTTPKAYRSLALSHRCTLLSKVLMGMTSDCVQTWGPGCLTPCRCSTQCDRALGTCSGVCDNGWIGSKCDQGRRLSAWASYQIRIIVGCACAGNAGNVFPATAG